MTKMKSSNVLKNKNTKREFCREKIVFQTFLYFFRKAVQYKKNVPKHTSTINTTKYMLCLILQFRRI